MQYFNISIFYLLFYITILYYFIFSLRKMLIILCQGPGALYIRTPSLGSYVHLHFRIFNLLDFFSDQTSNTINNNILKALKARKE